MKQFSETVKVYFVVIRNYHMPLLQVTILSALYHTI